MVSLASAEARRIRGFPGLPAGQPMDCTAQTAGPAQTSTTYKWTIRFLVRLSSIPQSTMGRVLLKVLFIYHPSFPSHLSHPIRSQGYHSGRQWVSPSTCSDTFLFPLLVLNKNIVPSRVGKTSLMNQYVNKRFSNQYKATIGADLYDSATPLATLPTLTHSFHLA